MAPLSTAGDIKVVTYNLHGFKNNCGYLCELTLRYDIIFLQEHWLLPSELYMLEAVNRDFVVFAKSSMEDKIKLGLMSGRPFGGVAVLMRRHLCNVDTFCGSSSDGRIISVKLVCNNFCMLLFGCYFPCGGTYDYCQQLSGICGYIEAVALGHPGARLCILGDLNFECDSGSPGYLVFRDFAEDYSVVSCDDLISDNMPYTYFHEALHHKSFLDHVFLGQDLKQLIDKYEILDDVLNTSDHLPVSFCLKIGDIGSTRSHISARCENIRDFRWDKGNLDVYYYNTGMHLSVIKHDFYCEGSHVTCADAGHKLDIEIYYAEIINALRLSTRDCIPCVPRSALKHYWTFALDDLKTSSKDAFDMWILCGRPGTGAVFDIMRDAKYKYKLAVRQAIRTYEDRFSDELYEHLLSKNMGNFWKVWSSKMSHKVLNVECIDGESDDQKIADVFCQRFSEPDVVQHSLHDRLDQALNNDVSVQPFMLSVEEVDTVIRSAMKRGKAAGVDNISLEHILNSHPSLVCNLCRLFNLMLMHSYVPNDFGRGIIIPLLKDKHGDINNSSNYRGITISPVISKIFECCLLLKFDNYFTSSELQFGFKKHLGCGPALFNIQQIIKYFNTRGSTVFVTAVDASKAFDRVNHTILIDKLISRGVPTCCIHVIMCWYGKLFSSVRWNSVYSKEFKVAAGVRQGGILSPILFNLYVDDLIIELKHKGDGCYVLNCFVGCIMYADDLILLSPSVTGLQNMLNTCSVYGAHNDIVFNSVKTVSVAIGPRPRIISNTRPVNIDKRPIQWVEQFKYLGVTFNAKCTLTVDVLSIKRRFYAALNSLMAGCRATVEPVKVQLVTSFCLPLLTYSIGALELSNGAVNELAVCWNDAFRKIFNYTRWESVKLLQFFHGALDFAHMYDMYRLIFLCAIRRKVPFLHLFFSSLELQFHTIQRLWDKYGIGTQSISVAVHDHFNYAVIQSYMC